MKKLTITLMLILSAQTANAMMFINLDWMPLSATAGMSYNEMESTYTGHRFATENEVVSLWNHFGIYDYNQQLESLAPQAQDFTNHFGFTWNNYGSLGLIDSQGMTSSRAIGVGYMWQPEGEHGVAWLDGIEQENHYHREYTGGWMVAREDNPVAAPEPATAVLLGLGLPFLRRRFM